MSGDLLLGLTAIGIQGCAEQFNSGLRLPTPMSDRKYYETRVPGIFPRVTDITIGKQTFPVVQQPDNDDTYVAFGNNFTQYRSPTTNDRKLIYVLNHNMMDIYAAENLMQPGSEITITVNNDKKHFILSDKETFQALQPTSPISNFRDTDPRSEQRIITSTDLYNRMVGWQQATGADTLIIQTCKEHQGEMSWGRDFYIFLGTDDLPENLKGRITKTGN